MNSVCIRRPAEFSGYSRLRSSASRSDGGSFSRISSWSSSSRPSSNSTASSDSSSRTPSATVSRFEFLEDFLADGVVDFVQCREIEIRAGQLHQADAVVGLERRDQVAEIGLMEFRDNRAQQRRIGGMDRARDLLDEFVANFAIFVRASEDGRARRIGGLGHVAYLRPCRASPV